MHVGLFYVMGRGRDRAGGNQHSNIHAFVSAATGSIQNDHNSVVTRWGKC